jgi:methylaspartate mutase epsilon subunit
VTCQPMSWREMESRRHVALATWPTGAEVDLPEALRFHESLPPARRVPVALRRASDEGRTLTQPRAGVAVLEEQIALLRILQDEGRADLLPVTVDSYTRHNRYREAERGLQESKDKGRSLLNGLPVVNYGVFACREIVNAIERPVQVRHGTPDARLLAEISLAAGFTSFEGGPISYSIPYAKAVSLEGVIDHWRYVDRLAGYYTERGAVINREPFGALTGTLVPPCLGHAVNIIEALLAAREGVKDITVGYGQCGCLFQDVAALVTLPELTREYLAEFGSGDVAVSTVMHEWMGGFPPQRQEAMGVIALGGFAAAFGRATKVITKSVEEALGVPTGKANAEGIRLTAAVMELVREQRLTERLDYADEAALIREEVRAIMAAVLALGEGDVGLGAVRAFDTGVLDVPFSPHRANKGLAIPVRDDCGAIRFLDFGNIPLPDSVKAYHRQRVGERAATEGRPPGFEMVLDDVYAVQSGHLIGRPDRAPGAPACPPSISPEPSS